MLKVDVVCLRSVEEVVEVSSLSNIGITETNYLGFICVALLDLGKFSVRILLCHARSFT